MKMRPRGRSASTSGPSSAATQATSRQAAAGRAPAQRDGGRTALGGYLHQMVVAWGLTAWAETLEERRDGTELDALVEVMRTGTSLHEAFDEDLAIGLDRFGLDPDTIGALVQIKYSRARHPRTLNAHDIEDIVQSFRRSIRRARNAGRSISRLVILSNRRLARPRRVADPSGKSAGTVRLPTEVENIPLSFITGIPDHLWREKLEAFARRYGCFDEEVLAGIQRLVGDLLDTAVHDPAQPIRRERLETALAGFPSPRPLTSTSIVEEPDEVALANLLEGTLWLPPSPVRRDVLDALDECTDHRALILITGFGGMGKTVALWQWIQTQRERMRHGDPIVATMRLGQFVDENYLASLARKWANDVTRASGRAGDTPTHALERLRLTNPGPLHAVLHLGLEGLEERLTSKQLHQIQDLIFWFWSEDQRCQAHGRPPTATLLLTCRDEEQFFERWLPDPSGIGLPYDRRPHIVKVKRFSWAELRSAAAAEDPGLVATITERMRAENADVAVSERSRERAFDALIFEKRQTDILSPHALLQNDAPFEAEDVSTRTDTLGLLRYPVL